MAVSADDLLHAMQLNMVSHAAYLPARMPGGEVFLESDLAMISSGVASPTYNAIARLNLTERDAARRLKSAIGYFDSHALPVSVWLDPLCAPEDLEGRLEAFGFETWSPETCMWRTLDDLPDEPLACPVRPVETRDDLADFVDVRVHRADPPEPAVRTFYSRASDLVLKPDGPIRNFVATVGGVPAGIATCFISHMQSIAGVVAGIYYVCVLPDFRGRGIGRAVTLGALRHAKARGATLGILESTAMGLPLYTGLGFDAFAEMTEYRRPLNT